MTAVSRPISAMLSQLAKNRTSFYWVFDAFPAQKFTYPLNP
jgi:hypothetical protein